MSWAWWSNAATQPITITMPTRWSGALFHAITRSTRPFKSTLAPYDTHQQPYPPHRIQPQQLHLGYVPNQPTRAAAAMQCSRVIYWIRTRYTWPLQCTPARWCAAQIPTQYPSNAPNTVVTALPRPMCQTTQSLALCQCNAFVRCMRCIHGIP